MIRQLSLKAVTKARRLVFDTIRYFRRYWQPLTASEKAFIETNSSFWKRYSQRQVKCESKYIFVRREQYPLILIGNAHISSIIASAKNLKLLFLIPSRSHRSMRKVLDSFPNATFVYEDSLRHFVFRRFSYLQAMRAMRSLHTPSDVLNFEIDGIRFGDVIYDTYLARGFATLRDVKDPALFEVVRSFFYHRGVLKHVMRRYNIELGFTSHTVGVSGATFFRYLLDSDIQVWEREGTLKKYNSGDNIHQCSRNPDPRYVEFMKNRLDKFIPLAERSLKERFDNAQLLPRDRLAYVSHKHTFISRQEFCTHFDLDPSKKNVFVMLHAFNDYPHTFGPLLYQDYYEWFRAVLEIAQTVNSVNWIFKEHPYARFYPTRDLNLETLFSKISSPHIVFLKSDADFNTISLRYIADAIVTCIGTAGLEYSTFGVPSILGGPSWYSGFGFTIEPQTAAELEEILRNIDTVQHLNDEQINMAKIIAFFTFDVINVSKFPDPFRTVCTFNYDEQRSLTSDHLFDLIVAHRQETNYKDKMRYVESLNEFISNPHYTQFVDLETYSFFQEAISGGTASVSTATRSSPPAVGG